MLDEGDEGVWVSGGASSARFRHPSTNLDASVSIAESFVWHRDPFFLSFRVRRGTEAFLRVPFVSFTRARARFHTWTAGEAASSL